MHNYLLARELPLPKLQCASLSVFVCVVCPWSYLAAPLLPNVPPTSYHPLLEGGRSRRLSNYKNPIPLTTGLLAFTACVEVQETSKRTSLALVNGHNYHHHHHHHHHLYRVCLCVLRWYLSPNPSAFPNRFNHKLLIRPFLFDIVASRASVTALRNVHFGKGRMTNANKPWPKWSHFKGW